MRILMVHNKYKLKGGEDESTEAEIELLRRKGHIVDEFYENNDKINKFSSICVGISCIWSMKNYKRLTKKLIENNYDLVHVQNFFPLISPSVFYAASFSKVPVVHTLRNYRLLCPNGLLLKGDRSCEICTRKVFAWPGVLGGCYRGKTLATLSVSLMLSIHKLLKTWEKKVDAFVALSEFEKEIFIKAGFPAKRIYVKPNFLIEDSGPGRGAGDFALYVGRLSVEKGVDILIQSWSKVPGDSKLKIIGSGPLEQDLKKIASNDSRISFLGRLPMAEALKVMGEAKVVVVPSRCHETFGRVVIESFSKGTPVLVSSSGAPSELVNDGKNGFRFSINSEKELSDKLTLFFSKNFCAEKFRENSRKAFLERFSEEKNYKNIYEIYAEVLRESNSFNKLSNADT
jgi:glycosyltransferase involved in cell wall biosynthesis